MGVAFKLQVGPLGGNGSKLAEALPFSGPQGRFTFPLALKA